MSSGRGREIQTVRKISLKYSELNPNYASCPKRLTIYEDGGEKDLIVRPTRRGIFVGCTFVSYDALDELVRISNEDK